LFDWDQDKNQPADRYARHELNSSVVEFVAPTEYMVRRSFVEIMSYTAADISSVSF